MFSDNFIVRSCRTFSSSVNQLKMPKAALESGCSVWLLMTLRSREIICLSLPEELDLPGIVYTLVS